MTSCLAVLKKYICVCVFLLHEPSLLSLQWLNPLSDVGVLYVGFDPGSQRSSRCTCTLCILTIRTKASQVRNNSVSNNKGLITSTGPTCISYSAIVTS